MRRGWSADRSQRVLFGEVPWGYRLNADRTGLVRDSKEQAVLAIVRYMRRRGRTLRQIVAELRGLGVVGRRGAPIGPTRVFQMIHCGRKSKRT
jgi:hypothetical protein